MPGGGLDPDPDSDPLGGGGFVVGAFSRSVVLGGSRSVLLGGPGSAVLGADPDFLRSGRDGVVVDSVEGTRVESGREEVGVWGWGWAPAASGAVGFSMMLVWIPRFRLYLIFFSWKILQQHGREALRKRKSRRREGEKGAFTRRVLLYMYDPRTHRKRGRKAPRSAGNDLTYITLITKYAVARAKDEVRRRRRKIR